MIKEIIKDNGDGYKIEKILCITSTLCLLAKARSDLCRCAAPAGQLGVINEKHHDFFNKKGELASTVKIAELPPYLGHSMSLSLFGVSGPNTPPPFADIAPPEARQDETNFSKETHFESEDTTGNLVSSFWLSRPVGWYFLQLNVILYRKKGAKMYAQVERFPFTNRPVEFVPDGQTIILPVSWPATSVEHLEHYGTMKPGGGGQVV